MAVEETDTLAQAVGRLNLDQEHTSKPHAKASLPNEHRRRRREKSSKTDGTITDSSYDQRTRTSQDTNANTPTGSIQAAAGKTYIPPHRRIRSSTNQSTETLTCYDAPPPPAPARPLQPQKYNAKAPAFKPEQQQKYERTSCNPPRVPQSDGIERTVNALPGKKTGSKPGVKPQSSSANQPPFDLPIRSSPGKLPHIQLLPRPKPTPHYMQQAMQDPQPRSHPRQLLVVVDLNGTLLFRKNRGSSFLARPKAKEFLRYILQNHKVMVWSSAQPENVRGMCDKLFTASQRDQLIAIWARDKLRLPPQALHQKVQVYKQLSWIWSDKSVRSTHPDTASVWSQVDTVLIDDSMEKAASEPYSIIQLEEFEGKAEQMEADVLGQVVSYLEMLRWEKDVSAYMQWMPFEFDPEMKVDWARFIGDTE